MKRLLKRGLFLAALTIGLVFHLAAQTTKMTIHLNDGTECTYFMSDDDRAYFEGNEVLVIEMAATCTGAKSDRYNLSDIRKITCNEVEGLFETTNASVSLSPNPVYDAFMLRNLTDKETIQIYALDGRKMKSVVVAGDQPIDVSDLGIGVYLVKTERQTLKMIKL